MSRPLLLDTCAAIWIVNGEALSASATEAIDAAYDSEATVFVSPITAWEIGQLAAKGKVVLQIPPNAWFERLLQVRGTHLAAMPPHLLIDSHFLPRCLLRDPADRILVATARTFDCCLITRDAAILDYAAEGHLRAIAC